MVWARGGPLGVRIFYYFFSIILLSTCPKTCMHVHLGATFVLCAYGGPYSGVHKVLVHVSGIHFVQHHDQSAY